MITKIILPLSCAVLIFILEGLALLKGVDGKCMALCAAIIGGLGGYSLPYFFKKLKSDKE